jgi:hypothetical protein
MAEFDQAARFAVKLDPAGFVRWLLPGLDADLLFTRWLDTQTIPFPGQPDRRCDTAAELTHASGLAPNWMLILELQTEPDADILERLLEYMARARRELRYGPHGRDKYLTALAVINLTGPEPHSVLDMELPGATDATFRCRARGLTFAKVSAGQTLAEVRAGQTARCLLPWLPLMKDGNNPETMTGWKEAAEQEPDHSVRSTYAGLALVFADLADCLTEWKQGLEGWNMKESRIIEAWRDEGRQEGRQEGRLETLRAILLRLLARRFPDASSSEVTAAVQSQISADELMRWLDLLDTVESLEAFRTAIKA